MPQIANIIVTDGTTPKTFSPTKVDSQRVFTLVDRSLGQKALDSIATVQSRDAGNDSQLVSCKVNIPHVVTNVDTGVSSVVENSHFKIEFRHANIASDAEREYLVDIAASLLADTQTLVRPVLQGDENFFG